MTGVSRHWPGIMESSNRKLCEMERKRGKLTKRVQPVALDAEEVGRLSIR